MMSISVLTEDGHTMQVPEDLLPFITLVFRTAALSQSGLSSPNDQKIAPIPLPKIRASTFSKILEWAAMHSDDPTVRASIQGFPCGDQMEGDLTADNTKIKLHLKSPTENKDDDDEGDYAMDDDEDMEADDVVKEEILGGSTPKVHDRDQLLCPADRKFLDSLDIPHLIDLTAAANYLAMEPLLDVCCKAIANHMSGLSVEELRIKFNIPNDFTPEEEAKLKSEFGWADD